MIKDRTCLHCNETFIQINPKVFSNHVRWCLKNPTRNNTEGISKAMLVASERKYGKLKDFNVCCEKCGIEYVTTEKEFKFPSKKHYFCSRECANSRGARSEEFKQIMRDKLSKPANKRLCPICNSEYSTKNANKKTCSKNAVSY